MLTNVRNKGFSLVELMVGMTVGIIVIFMVVSVYVSSKRNHSQNNKYNDLLENARYAVNVISNEIKHAGFIGGVTDLSAVTLDTSLKLDTDCGATSETNWVYDLTTYGSIQYKDDATTTEAHDIHDCIATTDFLADTNILALKRAYGVGVPVASLKLNTVYVRSDNLTACLWYYAAASNNPTGAVCPTTNFTDWQYLTSIYYIRPYAVTAGDNIPTLCKKVLSLSTSSPPEPTMDNICLAKGVEYFKILFGIDTDAVPDGVANMYDESPDDDDMKNAVAVRIFVLTRSTKADANYTNSKTYNLGGTTITIPANDHFYRKVFTTTVSIPNTIGKLKL